MASQVFIIRASVPEFPMNAPNRLHLAGSRRGFTLIEILVVSLVIALLSSIAVINIQQFVDNNKRKVVIADMRSLATAVGFAHDDMGFYPKLAFLQSSRRDPALGLYNPLATGDPDRIERFHGFFQAYDLIYQPDIPLRLWKGPYLNPSQSRAGAAQGQGGLAYVQMLNDPAFPPGNNVIEWPADVWDSPYCLYLMKWQLGPSGQYERRFLGRDIDGTLLDNEWRESPDAFTAIVSYGKNRVPGLGDYPDGAVETTRRATRLFTESSLTGVSPQPKYIMLGYQSFTQAMRLVLQNAPASVGAGPGILDPGSDDLIIEF